MNSFLLQELQDNLFLDKSEGGYFAAEEGASDIVIRLKDDHVSLYYL